jgi:asparagine synthase (glutamine-hydrolysing)
MCGIAGYFGLNAGADERRAVLRRMCDAMRHRGPDEDGYYESPQVGLGMRRLSIIDLEGGHQPVASDDGRIQLVFNGEIYNFAGLRKALRAQGATFRTASDTEVILRQYEAGGLDALGALNGMFAIAIWDGRDGTLTLVRDRLGVKPLYYFWDGRQLVFASEIKAILASKRTPASIEPRSLWDYLTFRYVPGPGSIWKQIYKLPPAHRLTISVAQPQPRLTRYWDIPYSEPARAGSDEQFDQEFAELFTDAVNLRMIADVPVGVLLSGGLDSSAVAAAIARVPGARLSTFSVAFADSPDIDERPYAREVATHIGADHHEIVIDKDDFIGYLPRFVVASDEPLADLASIPLYYVCRLAREQVKVVLSGEGSDEVLGGYNFDDAVRAWDDGRPSRGGLLRRLLGRFADDGDAIDLRREPVPMHMTNYMDSAGKRALMPGHEHPDSLDVVRDALARVGSREPLHQALYAYCQNWLVEDLLMKADKMSMANSLELRTPFLDYRLVEWAARAPAWVKVGRDPDGQYRTKRVLRRFARHHLPERVITRPKQGFPVPVYRWLSGHLKPWAHDLLGGRDARSRAWFAGEGIEALLASGTAPSAVVLDQHRLWNLLILELWLREWQA